ncbi:MAG: acyl-CoA dehydrogenase family protein [Kofleriaceae bacterium]
MNPRATEQQASIVETATRFAKQLRAAMRASEANGVSSELAQAWHALDLIRMDWPSSRGGFEVGKLTKAMTLETLAFGDAAATLALDRVSWVCSPLLEVDAIADRVIAEIDGKAAFTPGLVVDSDRRLELDAQRCRGAVEWLGATAPTQLFVMRGDQLAYLRAGFTATPRALGALHALGGSAVNIDGAPEWMIDLTPAAASRLRGSWRLYLSAVLVGLAEAASRQTREFCLERVTFGKKVAHHQAVAFLLADMEIAVEAARMLLWQEAGQLDADPKAVAGHSAFVQAVECALFVTNYAVQLHGSHGYVEDFPVEKWMREARAIALITGGVDAARADLGAMLAERLAVAR